jgi:hypothetical protein
VTINEYKHPESQAVFCSPANLSTIQLVADSRPGDPAPSRSAASSPPRRGVASRRRAPGILVTAPWPPWRPWASGASRAESVGQRAQALDDVHRSRLATYPRADAQHLRAGSAAPSATSTAPEDRFKPPESASTSTRSTSSRWLASTHACTCRASAAWGRGGGSSAPVDRLKGRRAPRRTSVLTAHLAGSDM